MITLWEQGTKPQTVEGALQFCLSDLALLRDQYVEKTKKCHAYYVGLVTGLRRKRLEDRERESAAVALARPVDAVQIADDAAAKEGTK